MVAHKARQGHKALADDILSILYKECKKQGAKVIQFPKDLRDLVLTEESETLKFSTMTVCLHQSFLIACCTILKPL